MIASTLVDAVLCIGCLIKGETMHFEYINEAVTQVCVLIHNLIFLRI